MISDTTLQMIYKNQLCDLMTDGAVYPKTRKTNYNITQVKRNGKVTNATRQQGHGTETIECTQ
jgi:hypothetical protein